MPTSPVPTRTVPTRTVPTSPVPDRPVLAVEPGATTQRPASRASRHAWTARLEVLRRAAHGDTGDVPGWVLVTLMTAGLVLAIWAVAGPALTDLFTTAIARVTTFGG